MAAAFATFELCRYGLVVASEKPKYRRVATGCLECRQRKKKCDEQRPICSNCSKRKIPSDCTWPQPGKSRSPRDSEESEPVSVSQMVSDNRDDHGFSDESIDESCSDHTIIDQTVKISDLGQSCFTSISGQAVERHIFEVLKSRLELFTYNSSLNRDLSFISLVLPLTIAYSATKNAFLACGAVLLANSDQTWIATAQYYHTKAIHNIRTSLSSSGKEQALSAILLLHLFEELRTDIAWPTRVHLAGAHGLIQSVMDQRPPTTALQRLMIEVFIYRVAVASTFGNAPDLFATDTSIQKFSKILLQSPVALNHSYPFDRDTILGVPSGMFDIVSRISLLRRNVPLQPLDEIRAVRIISKLQTWITTNAEIDSDPYQPKMTELSLQAVLTTDLYYLACYLLLKKILNPTLQTNDAGIRMILQRALIIWSKFSAAGFGSPTIKWPLVILGCGAVTETERRMFREPFETLSSLGVGSAQHVLALFRQAWGTDLPEVSDIGLDVLLRNDLLLSILL